MVKKSSHGGAAQRVVATALSAAMVVAFSPAVGIAVANDDDASSLEEASSSPAGQNAEQAGHDADNGGADAPVQDSSAANAEAVILNGSEQRFYDDAAAAASALKDGETLTLLKNYEGQLKVNACATIDLGGHTVTNTSTDPAIDVFVDGSNRADAGDVTIKNGKVISNGDAVRVEGTETALNVNLYGTQEGEALTLQCPLDYSPVHLRGSARIECKDESQAKEDIGNGFYVPASDDSESGYAYGIEDGLTYAAKFANSGGTIKLLDNYEGPQKLVYSEGGDKFLTLDLNDKTYHCTAAGDNQAALEFTASDSCLLMKEGRIISDSAYAICALAGASSSANNLRLKLDYVTVIATNGIGLRVSDGLTGAYVLLENSQVTSDKQAAICFSAKGFMDISATDISAETVGVAVKSGTVNISEGTGIYTNSENVVSPSDYCMGSESSFTASGYALYVEGGDLDGVAVNVNGGVLGSVGEAIKTFAKPEDASKVKVAVAKGRFSSDVSAFMDKSASVEYATHNGYFLVQLKDEGAPNNTAGYYWDAADENGVRSEILIPYSPPAPVVPVTPRPAPSPEPTPVAPGTDVSGVDGAGNAVEVTVTDNSKTSLPDGTEAAGSVEFKGATGASGSGSSEPAKSVDIPATVTVNGLTYVVTKIADEAFASQSQLESVNIPETVVEIGSKAFAGTSIFKVVIPAATKAIGDGAFQGCKELNSVDIKSFALTNIPADAFNGSALRSIDIPASVTSIGARAFKGTKLKTLATGAGLEAIGPKALAGAKNLKVLTVTSKGLTKKGVKNSLKGSSVRKVEVAVSSSKATLSKYVAKYGKIFKKSNSGKSVRVVPAKGKRK